MGRALLVAASVAALAACGGVGAGHHAQARSAATPARTAARVTVVAPVLHVHSGAPMACEAILTSVPPAGCGGVRVAGYDFRRVAGLVRYRRDVWQTPLLRIAGVWDGGVLHVRRVARARSAPPAPPLPGRCRARATAGGMALARRVGRGPFAALGAGPCGRAAWVLVPLADPATVRAIRARYGRRVAVQGWLLASPVADR